MQIIAGCEAFDCLNIPPLRLNRQDTATVNRRAIEDHRTTAAGRAITNLLSSRVIEGVAQSVQQCDTRLQLELMCLAVHDQNDGSRVGSYDRNPIPAQRGSLGFRSEKAR